MNKHSIFQIPALLLLSLVITACGGGGGGGSDSGDTSTEQVVENSGSNNTVSSTPAPDTEPDDEPALEPDPAPTPAPDAEADPVSNTATISLNWNAPTTRADNSPLVASDIGGYEIYYYLDGSSINDGQVVTVDDGSTTYTTPPLNPGTYHFAIATYDTNQVYSDLSPPVTATID